MKKKIHIIFITLLIIFTYSSSIFSEVETNNFDSIDYEKNDTNKITNDEEEIVDTGNTPPEDMKKTDGDDFPIVIIEIADPYANDVVFLFVGEDPTTLELDTFAYAVYGDFDAVPCEIVWRYSELDNSTSGKKTLIGDILLPEGYIFEGEPLTVARNVIIYEESEPPVVSISSFRYSAINTPIVIPLGTPVRELDSFFTAVSDNVLITTEEDETFSCPLSVNLSKIDTNTVGNYYPFEFDLPPAVTFNGQESLLSAVYVVPKDTVDLHAVRYGDTGFIVPWIYPAENLILWSSINNGTWNKLEADGPTHPFGLFHNDKDLLFNGLEIFYRHLNSGNEYRFQVEYDNNRFSDVLIIDLIDSDVPKISNLIEGDRPGYDREEDDPPTFERPSLPWEDPTEEIGFPPLLMKPPSDTSVVISGERLEVLMDANPNFVPFLQGNLFAAIPTKYLRDLFIKKTDIVTVDLENSEINAGSPSVSINGEPVTKPLLGGIVSRTSSKNNSSLAKNKQDQKSLNSSSSKKDFDSEEASIPDTLSSNPLLGGSVKDLDSEEYRTNSIHEKNYKDNYGSLLILGAFVVAGVLTSICFLVRRQRIK